MQVGEKKLRQTLLAGTAAIALMVGVPEIAAAGDNSSSGVSASVEGRYYFGFGDEFVHGWLGGSRSLFAAVLFGLFFRGHDSGTF